jgi:hypothetical protein
MMCVCVCVYIYIGQILFKVYYCGNDEVLTPPNTKILDWT